MTPHIRLQRSQISDLEVIRDIEPKLFGTSLQLLTQKLGTTPVLPDKVFEVLQEAIPAAAAESTLRQMISMHGTVRQLQLSPDEMFDGLNAAIERDTEWNQAEISRWTQVAEGFRQLFTTPVIGLSAKALNLCYEHPRLLQGVRILTDVRPIFNDDASNILGNVVSHTLLLRYDDIEGDHTLSVALDADDLVSLIEQCDRALTKGQTSQKVLRAANLPTILPGETENE